MKDEKGILKIKETLEVLDDINRLSILRLIAIKNSLCVCEIFNHLDLPQNLVSYHLQILREAGLIKSQKSGRKVFYSLDRNGLIFYKNIINNFFIL